MKNLLMKSRGAIATLACLILTGAFPAAAQIDQQQAAAFFEEAAVLCEREGGRLWGVSLCGPMVFADPVTGMLSTNQPAPDAPRPQVLGYANAALEWGAERWSTFVWQMIPKDDQDARARLMLHELFHRVQPELGLYVPASEGTVDHLDGAVGRYWMRLEWRALTRAIGSSGPEQEEAVRDALAFRAKRRSLFPGAAEGERMSEINEGMAQYTATVAAASSRRAAVSNVVAQLVRASDEESFVRTFAYPSGASYGILLDAWVPDWRQQITSADDLGKFLMDAGDLEASENIEAAVRRYDGAELWEAEAAREADRQARIAELRARFVEGPVLVMPRGRNASFITTGVTPVPDAGTIYPSFRVTGEWGRLEAQQVLMSPDGGTLTVPAPVCVEGAQVSGEGWTVTLAPGWTVEPGPRQGDFQVVPKDR